MNKNWFTVLSGRGRPWDRMRGLEGHNQCSVEDPSDSEDFRTVVQDDPGLPFRHGEWIAEEVLETTPIINVFFTRRWLPLASGLAKIIIMEKTWEDAACLHLYYSFGRVETTPVPFLTENFMYRNGSVYLLWYSDETGVDFFTFSKLWLQTRLVNREAPFQTRKGGMVRIPWPTSGHFWPTLSQFIRRGRDDTSLDYF